MSGHPSERSPTCEKTIHISGSHMHICTRKPDTPVCCSDYFTAILNRWLSAHFAKSNTVPNLKYCQALEVLRRGRKNPQFSLCLFSSQFKIQIYNYSPLQL